MVVIYDVPLTVYCGSCGNGIPVSYNFSTPSVYLIMCQNVNCSDYGVPYTALSLIPVVTPVL